ncbi:glycosyltransferase family 2 protein [Methylomonas sp. LL1]|uniref:glycosyltransferase family 2 protein n=1 Tax=Methylomonas sp. LL1 TaxID=2785785 RepID=UPI0018C35758|nr:glycosyltransferase family 2 protein [Methylomonas sp. LL1]QPK64919.1 glycosyltransferase family 2 protein [Methylomonas sp. LL1]
MRFELQELVKGKDDMSPLVSVGIPTYNRPNQLKLALESISRQTYRNLEIIVSDNASTDPEVACVLNECSRADDRIRWIRQNENIGASANFAYVLGVSSGDYFMWAADDDERECWFIERCLSALQSYPRAAAASAEVRYICDGHPMPLFPQSAAFYQYKFREGEDSLSFVLENNVDNLVYSLFRRSALLIDGQFFWQRAGMRSTNEIPAILYAAYHGGFVVLPTPGFFKSVSNDTYNYIYWEFCGGKIPAHARLSSLSSIKGAWRYHQIALKEICRSIDLIPIAEARRRSVKWLAKRALYFHYFQMLVGRKRARKSVPKEFHG